MWPVTGGETIAGLNNGMVPVAGGANISGPGTSIGWLPVMVGSVAVRAVARVRGSVERPDIEGIDIAGNGWPGGTLACGAVIAGAGTGDGSLSDLGASVAMCAVARL
jgi:hypothetical protein